MAAKKQRGPGPKLSAEQVALYDRGLYTAALVRVRNALNRGGIEHSIPAKLPHEKA